MLDNNEYTMKCITVTRIMLVSYEDEIALEYKLTDDSKIQFTEPSFYLGFEFVYQFQNASHVMSGSKKGSMVLTKAARTV